LAPREMPMKRLVKILIRAVVDPTAASAWLLLYLPTTMISTALNISCRMLDSIRGSEKEISLSMMVPLHMSISYLLFFKMVHPLKINFCIAYLTAIFPVRQYAGGYHVSGRRCVSRYH